MELISSLQIFNQNPVLIKSQREADFFFLHSWDASATARFSYLFIFYWNIAWVDFYVKELSHSCSLPIWYLQPERREGRRKIFLETGRCIFKAYVFSYCVVFCFLFFFYFVLAPYYPYIYGIIYINIYSTYTLQPHRQTCSLHCWHTNW